MKKIILLILIASVGLLAGSCTKAVDTISNILPTSGNSFTINGDGFNSRSMDIKIVATKKDSFSKTFNTTSLLVTGASDTFNVTMALIFTGDSLVSNRAFSLTNNMYISITPYSKTSATKTYNSSTGNFTVSQYGTVNGGSISGVFSGTFTGVQGTSATVSITNGKFIVPRTQ